MSNEHSRLLSYWLLVISTGIIIGVVVFLITEAIKSDAIGSVINKYFPKPTSADSNKKMSNDCNIPKENQIIHNNPIINEEEKHNNLSNDKCPENNENNQNCQDNIPHSKMARCL